MTAEFPEPEIVEAPERHIAALSQEFTMETRHEIPALWRRLWVHDFEIEGLNRNVAFGASYGLSPDGRFNYGAGYEVGDPSESPNGGCIVTLAGGQYLKFSKRTEIARIPALFNYVFGTWFPNSGQQQAEGAVFELYPEDPDATETARLFELWVPIKSD